MTPTVLPHFPSTGPKLMSCPRWYTRSAFPVPTASFCPFGTPEARFLYQHISYSIWYTRSTSPVPTHLLFHLVHQKRVSCTNTSLIPFGTPEARFLYQHISYSIWYTRSAFPVPTASFCPFGTPEARFLYQCAPVYSVHAKASSRTFSVLWNNRRPILSGMKSYAHLKQHSLDN